MATKVEESQELAVKEENVALAAFVNDFEDYAGVGSENVESQDMAIPFIKIAQSLSPEVNKKEAAYIPGLEVGDFFNSATKEIVAKADVGFKFVPILYKRQYLEWVPRDNGGGLAGEHGPEIIDKCRDDGKGSYFLPNGNEVIITALWFVLMVTPDGNYQQAVLSLAKTQFKKSKNLVSTLKNLMVPRSKGPGKFNPPFFYSVIAATSNYESNDQGNWYGWAFKIDGRTQDIADAADVLQFAVQTHKDVSSGQIKAALDKIEDVHDGKTIDGASYGGGNSKPRGEEIDGDIPF
jgi:hypothetical protein